MKKFKAGDRIALSNLTSDTQLSGVIKEARDHIVMPGVQVFRLEGLDQNLYGNEWILELIEEAKPDRPKGLYIAEGVTPSVAIPLRVRTDGGPFERAYDMFDDSYNGFVQNANSGQIGMVRLIVKGDNNV